MSPLSTAILNSILDAYARAVAFSNAAVWAKLHTGDPGTAGTLAAATEITRQQVAFASAAAAGAIANTSATSWTNVAGTETITWLSYWTAVSAGTFTGRVQLTAPKALTAGDTLTFPIGSLTLTGA